MARKDHISDLPKLLTGEELLRALGITRKDPKSFLYRLRARGVVQGIKIGADYRYPIDSVRNLLTGKVGSVA